MRLVLIILSLNFAVLGQSKELIVLDFEGNATYSKWPEDRPGEIVSSTEWKSKGRQSLAIDANLLAAIEILKTRNWKGYDVLRMDTFNPSGTAVKVGFELRDKHSGFHDRHDNNVSVPSGKHTVEIDISGDLWRGEENRPYIGKVKKPIDKSFIKRFALFNRGTTRIYIDNVRLATVKKISVPGGYAFDFGKRGTQVMGQYLGVFDDTLFAKNKSFGFTGKTQCIGKSMSFPTSLLGDGVGFQPDTRFHVNLKGGDYLGLVVFERGGFWANEQAAYTKAELRINQDVVHSHKFDLNGAEFMFQDTEITKYDNIMNKLIWPAHGKAQFSFKAKKGRNTLSLNVKNSKKYPLRIAGLVLAPNTHAGKTFIKDHIALQEKAFKRSFGHTPKGKGNNNVKGIIVEALHPGAMIYPGSTPRSPSEAMSIKGLAVPGQTFTVHLGVYSSETDTITVSSALQRAKASYGVYMPMRPYGTGATWLEVSHYLPKDSCSVGPGLARSIIVEYSIDMETPHIKDTIEISASNEVIRIPVNIEIVPVHLATIPIPVGLFMNASYIDPNLIDSATWWSIQDSLLKEQMGAGLTALSGGIGLRYTNWKQVEPNNIEVVQQFIKLAQTYGTIHAIVSYGGFFNNLKYIKNFDQLASLIHRLETDYKLPPHYLYAYDEPRSGTDQYKAVLKILKQASQHRLRTIGYTSFHRSAEWDSLIKMTTAPALNLHKPNGLAWVTKQPNIGAYANLKKDVWVYNNGQDRYGLGMRLWQGHQLGVSGRMEWIGCFKQGFAFHNLDGREPSQGSFLLHKLYGMLKTPKWLAAREGLLDARIRYTIETHVKPNDPILSLWSIEQYKKTDHGWTDEKLASIRQAYLKRLIKVVR